MAIPPTSTATLNYLRTRWASANRHWGLAVFHPQYPDDEPPDHPRVIWAETWRIRTKELELEIMELPETRRHQASNRVGEEVTYHTPEASVYDLFKLVDFLSGDDKNEKGKKSNGPTRTKKSKSR